MPSAQVSAEIAKTIIIRLKMGLKKGSIIIAVLVFFVFANISFCNAAAKELTFEDLLQQTFIMHVSNVIPTIDVVFDDSVILDDVKLYGIGIDTMKENNSSFRQFLKTKEDYYILRMKPGDVSVKNQTTKSTVSITPVNALSNGYYILKLSVEDLAGNTAVDYEYFYLYITETEIMIIEPRLGISNLPVNNLTIRTVRDGKEENTECKIGIGGPYPLNTFDSPSLKPFESPAVMKPEHTIDNVFSVFGLGASGQFYILCKDQSLGRVTQKKFDVGVDTAPPAISSITFDPPKIVEYPETGNEISAVIEVDADEPVICRYSFNEDKSYDDMTAFSNFDRYDVDAYTDKSTQKQVIPSDKKATYTFYVECEDKAGWTTGKQSAQLEVDLSAGLGITVTFPPRYTTNKTINLLAAVNKRSVCQIKGGSISNYASMSSYGTDQKTYSYNLGTLTDGSYTYDINCISRSALQQQEQTYSYTFTIDNTKPNSPNITGSPVTCSNQGFAFTPPLTLSAEDRESGIDHFMLEIRSGTSQILNWTNIGSSISGISEGSNGKDIVVDNTTTYTFNVKAVNGVGLESASPKSFSVKYNPADPVCLEKNPPDVTINENQTTGKTDIEFVCSDESGCDDTQFYYGISGSKENCTADTLLQGPPFTIEIRETQFVCYLAYDTVGNNATGGKFIDIEFAASCADLRKDGDETDMDCGGTCSPCEIGKSCLQNMDCGSNYCSNGTCEEAKCDDTIKNGPLNNEESDIDCGGYCSALGFKCDLGKVCGIDDDCKTGFCNPDTGKCAESTCTDGLKGPDEGDIDCGGPCPTKCSIDSGCSTGDDCLTGYCIGGRCKEKPVLVPIETKSSFGLIFIILGIIMILGGSGYLTYKKMFLPPAKPAPLTPEKREEEIIRARKMEEQRKAQAEMRRRMLEEQRQRDELARKRLEETEKKRAEDRDKLFGAFGGKVQPARRTGTIGVRTGAKPGPAEVTEEKREGWLSLGALKEKFMPSKKEGIEEDLKAPSAPKPQTVFEELGRIGGPSREKEKAEEETEDVYRRLDTIQKKGERGAFDALGDIGPKDKDVYDELRKYVKPEKKEKTKNRK